MNKSYCKYQDKAANIIREKSRTDPKGLWKILNNIDRKKSDVSNNVTLEQFVEYFKNLNELPENEKDQEIGFDSVDRENVHNILNSPITEEEILRVVKNLKSNKASGYDDIVNEHIKSTINIFLPIYCKLFNIVLNSGLFPESWSEGVIFPIYKNKGDTKDPSSYRPITLVSCLSKTFTSVLNDRLCELSDEVGLISESQTGFRKGYSTLDNIFSLHALISIYMSLGKILYCTCFDFSKAFDTITRSSLWVKLQKSNITGKVFRIIHSLNLTMSSLVLRIMISFHHFSGVILVLGKGKILTRSFLLSI